MSGGGVGGQKMTGNGKTRMKREVYDPSSEKSEGDA